MKFLLFMCYLMLVAICGHMGIIVGDNVWLSFDFIGVIALIISIVKDSEV